MADRKLFYENPALARVETVVVESGEEGGRPWVRLRETILYPEGGGQPADRGAIAGVRVIDVQSREDSVLHFLERPLPPGPVEVALDWDTRFDRSQQHTAQHLLSAILADRHDMPTTAFHLGDSYTAIEVAGPVPPVERLREVEEEVNAAIRLDLAVRTRWVEPEQLGTLPVRTRGLPEGHSGPVRLVEIGALDLNTCGGTHVSRLCEIQLVHLVDAAAARGGARIRFVAGGRVQSELRRAEQLESELKARIGTAPEEFARVLDGWEADRKRLERRVRDLERDLAERIAEEVSAQPTRLLARFVPGATPDSLRRLASSIVARRPEAVVVLAGGEEGTPCFLVQSGPSGPEDVSTLGRRVRDLLGAKGGGSGRTYQGRGGTWPGEARFLAAIS